MVRFFLIIFLFFFFACRCYSQEGLLFPKSSNNDISSVKIFCRDFSFPSAHRIYGTVNPAMFNYIAASDSAYASELCIFNLPDSLISDLFLYPLQDNSMIQFSLEARINEVDMQTFDTAALIVVRSESIDLPYFFNISFKGDLRVDGIKAIPFPTLTKFLKDKCTCKQN